MLIEKKKVVNLRKCRNGHYDWAWSDLKYCVICGTKILIEKEEMTITACDHCGKEVNASLSPHPKVLFCPHCGAMAGEHLGKEHSE